MAPKHPCALKLAGFEPDAGFRRAVQLLSRAAICHEPYSPPSQPGYRAVQQHMRNDDADFSLGWHGGDKLSFLESAKTLPHPAQRAELALPADLLAAVRFVVRKREDIEQWRRDRIQLLLDCQALVRVPDASTRLRVCASGPLQG